MGVTNSFSVEARRSHFGVHMCSVIHVWDSSQNSHTHAYCRKGSSGQGKVEMDRNLTLKILKISNFMLKIVKILNFMPKILKGVQRGMFAVVGKVKKGSLGHCKMEMSLNFVLKILKSVQRGKFAAIRKVKK